MREAFAESVLWAGDLLAEHAAPAPAWLIDATTLVVADRHGIADQLAATEQGKYTLDGGRSVPAFAESKSFPDNTELEAILTFQGDGKGTYVRAVAVDPTSLTLHQRLSLVRLPGPGFRPRLYHPASGAGGPVTFLDFAQPLGASLTVRYQCRFRLDKVDPGLASSPVVKPIVYYLDPGTPEPVRSALLDGARWWQEAFAAAGFVDAFRVELLPPGVDPDDVRYNVIVWAHRATRGWSYGDFLADPRTGEIIRGRVTLGSQRVRQDILIAESLTAPYGPGGDGGQAAREMALARLRQLAAHEVGHTLGFAHNFAASWRGHGAAAGSVMDYPHPLLRLADGKVVLDDAYGVGVGPWDHFLVAHGYAEVSPDEEPAALARLRADVAAQGLRYVSDPDARAPGAAHPDGLLWDFGADAVVTFDQLLAIRKVALAGFSTAVSPANRDLGELAARLVPVYLLHRYQTEAVARRLGGATYGYGEIGDSTPGATPVMALEQRAALARLVSTLAAETLALPANVLALLTPPGAERGRSREDFATRMTPLFDPLAAAEAAAALTTGFLFDPARLNRLSWQHAVDAAQPGIADLMRSILAGTWRHVPGGDAPGRAAVQAAANWVALDAAVAALDSPELHPQVAAELRAELTTWQRTLAAPTGGGTTDPGRSEAARYLAAYLTDPGQVVRRTRPEIPPGAPI